MKECKHWTRYQGKRAPRCNRGRGCDICRRIYVYAWINRLTDKEFNEFVRNQRMGRALKAVYEPALMQELTCPNLMQRLMGKR